FPVHSRANWPAAVTVRMTRLPKLALFALIALAGCSRTELLFCGNGSIPCPKSFVCVAQRCVPGEGGAECPNMSQVRCGDTCVDLTNTAAHCGACNRACPTDQACQAGSCVSSCSSGTTNCMGSCVDLRSDVTHCGNCT